MNDLIGFEEEFDSLLKKYKANSLHSSIIIHGSRGIGKNLFVNNFIINIFKSKFKHNEYKHHYNLLKNNSHPNIKLLKLLNDQKTKKKKKNITIEQIRELKKFINESSSISELDKFIIIDSADDLNINASNSFLKNLEEPNNGTFIFLICHQLSSIIPTIRSRCLKIKLNNHSYSNFETILNEKIDNLPNDKVNFLYHLTYGSPGDAIFFYEQEILEILDLTLNSMATKDIDKNKIDISNILARFDNDKFKSFLSLLKSILILLNKLKNNPNQPQEFLSDNFISLNKILNNLSKKNILDRFNFLTKNEQDLFNFNLDKRLFILKFLTN